MQTLKRVKTFILLVSMAVFLSACETKPIGLPKVKDKSPCTGYVKTGGNAPCESVPVNDGPGMKGA